MKPVAHISKRFFVALVRVAVDVLPPAHRRKAFLENRSIGLKNYNLKPFS